MNIAGLLDTNVQKYGTQPAVGFKKKDGWKEIGWPLFRDLVYKTANALRELGVEENDRVAIFSDNSAEWITFDLAILSLGAVTVPIYATSTKEQAEYIINDSEAKIILVGNQAQYDTAYEIMHENPYLKQVVVAKKMVWIKKDRTVYFEDLIEKSSAEFQVVKKQADDLATLIYTSGTTGIPKGVMITHGNIVQAAEAHFDFFKFKNFDKEHSLAFLPLAHVFERSWTLLCLYGGAKVSFLEDTKLIAHALAEVRPTMMCAVPRFYQKIYAGVLQAVADGSSTKKKIFDWALKTGSETAELKRTEQKIPFGLSLKQNIAEKLVFAKIKNKMGGRLWFMPCGGASLSEDVTRFFDAIGIHITVGYGLTETTATLTAFPLKHYKHGSAGIPVGNTKIKIGDNGEILAKGTGIMKGYYKKPDETAQVFTEDGWFKTGDAGEIDDKGNLTITDRIKDLMKTSNGKYIAPQPIENMFSNSGLIDQIMLIAEGRPFVTALIVPNFELLKTWLEDKNIPFTTWEQMVELPDVKELYRVKIEEIQKNNAGVDKVKKFTLMPSEFEISSGEITPTLKVKRNVVIKKYGDLIEKMYAH